MYCISGNYNDPIGKKIGEWFAEKQKLPVTGPYSAICWGENVGNDIRPVAAAIFNDYNGSSIEAHFYGPKGLTPRVIHNITEYVYTQLGCNILLVKIPRNNKFKRLLPRLSFKYIAVIPEYFGKDKKGDAIMYVLKKEDAKKWIR